MIHVQTMGNFTFVVSRRRKTRASLVTTSCRGCAEIEKGIERMSAILAQRGLFGPPVCDRRSQAKRTWLKNSAPFVPPGACLGKAEAVIVCSIKFERYVRSLMLDLKTLGTLECASPKAGVANEATDVSPPLIH